MRRANNYEKNKFFIKIKGYFYIVVSIILIISLVRNISRIKRAEERIDRARSRVENLEQQRDELQARLDESQSEIYLETQLRDGLGLAQQDEIVIVLPEEEVLRRIAPDTSVSLEIEKQNPIWKRWLSLFFTLED